MRPRAPLLALAFAIACSSTPPAEGSARPTPASPTPAAPRSLPEFCGAASSDPVTFEPQATLIKDGFVFVEGPTWSAEQQRLFFSEMNLEREGPTGPPATIHALAWPETIEVWLPSSGTNGLAIDGASLIACTHDTQTLSRYDLATKARSTVVADIDGKHFNSPNDVALHSQGHIYFSDPDWQLGPRTNETGVTGVYWVDPNGTVTLADGTLDKPNGVTLSPDETTLYVGAVDGTVARYPVMSDGSLGPREAFVAVDGPDGMTVDCAGNLYVTSHGAGQVHVFDRDGAMLGTIAVAPRTTNVAFGGPDRRQLFITAGGGLYRAEVSAPGFPY